MDQEVAEGDDLPEGEKVELKQRVPPPKPAYSLFIKDFFQKQKEQSGDNNQQKTKITERM
jgi:hypothetical protein